MTMLSGTGSGAGGGGGASGGGGSAGGGSSAFGGGGSGIGHMCMVIIQSGSIMVSHT